ncbi:MAG: radical SAM protein [Sulfuricurvum sp.]|nr:radical SAM protein [Sulfuricurvum sp.]MDD5386138.1 radical SAM protein [Sulfuricurvum sp.]
MLRVSNLIRASIEGGRERVLDGAIAIWNLTNRCNLSCLHCYSKATLESEDALDTNEIFKTMADMAQSGIKFIIFSGGEPLTRHDIFDIAARARELGIITYLSTNGLYVHKSNVEKIVAAFDYIGVSIDGREETHDHFRGLKGSFKLSMEAIKLLLQYSNRVGIRFTLTTQTLEDLPFIFELAETLNIPKVYISHLVYSGRGLENRAMDLSVEQRIEAVKFVLSKAFDYYETNKSIEVVTGNMEMDAISLFEEFSRRYPEHSSNMHDRLLKWGGNSAGRKLVNIDSRGNVKPDPFFPVTLGSIKEKPFGLIWNDPDNALLTALRTHPRVLEGKCSKCEYLSICNGGSRARAYAVHGTLNGDDPSCYLDQIFHKDIA